MIATTLMQYLLFCEELGEISPSLGGKHLGQCFRDAPLLQHLFQSLRAAHEDRPWQFGKTANLVRLAAAHQPAHKFLFVNISCDVDARALTGVQNRDGFADLLDVEFQINMPMQNLDWARQIALTAKLA